MKTIIFFLIFSSNLSLLAQNLVQNPSFEMHSNIDCLLCYKSRPQFDGLVKGWKSVGMIPLLYDNKDISEECEIEPFDGSAFIGLEYKPNCLHPDAVKNTKANWSSRYIGAKLKKTLKIGIKYKVSFMVYIKEAEISEFPNQIGFSLFPSEIVNQNGLIIFQNNFTLKAYKKNEWFEASWIVQPTCNLSFLVIGAFKTNAYYTKSEEDKKNIYYIDKVSVQEVDKIEKGIKAIHFCKEEAIDEAGLRKEIETTITYFDSNSSTLSQSAQEKLDTIAQKMKANPKACFFVGGHTDNVGSNHKELGKARINTVIDYLNVKHKIPKIRFVKHSFGAENPIENNQTDIGKGKNRRVEIQHGTWEVHDVIYRNILIEIGDNDLKQAFKNLNIWLKVAPHKDKLKMLYDPKLNPLKTGQKWTFIQKQVKDSYDVYGKQKDLAFSLDSLWAEDQKCRTLVKYIENLVAWVPEIDEGNSFWDVNMDCPSDSLIAFNDKSNYERLMELVGENNWVKSSEVGERAAKANFLIIQHEEDVNKLKSFLPIIKNRCENGEADWIYYALMYDRIKVNQDLPQKYGTQFKNEGFVEYFPMENADSINIWRDQIGLNPIEF